MIVLVGNLSALNTNFDISANVLLSDKKDALTNDYCVNLLNMDTEWSAADATNELFIGKDRATGKQKYTATRADLIFGSHSELRAVSEVYACADAKEKREKDFPPD